MNAGPLTEVRKHLGLSVGAMAAPLGGPYHALYHAARTEVGPPHKVRSGLEELGVNVADLEQQQKAWVAERAKRLRAELLRHVNTTTGRMTA